MSDAPSGYDAERVLQIWHDARERLLADDPTLEGDEEALADLLGPVQGYADDLITRTLRAKVHAEAMAAAADEQAKLIIARRNRYRAREDVMKQLAVDLMTATKRKKFEIPDMTASVIAGRVGVHIPDPDKVPDNYCEVIVTKKPDKETIMAFLEAGETVPGAELKTGPNYLMIRRA